MIGDAFVVYPVIDGSDGRMIGMVCGESLDIHPLIGFVRYLVMDYEVLEFIHVLLEC